MANNSAVAFSLLFSIVKYYKIQVKFEIGDNQQNFDQVMALFMPPPPHNNGRGIKFYSCPSVHLYLRT